MVPKNHKQVEDWLTVHSRADLRTALNYSSVKLTLPQVQRLISHAESLEPNTHCLRLGIIHTYTSDLLDPWLDMAATLEGLELHTYHAPYGVTLQEAHPNSGLVKHAPDLTLLLLRSEDLHPDMKKPLCGLSVEQQVDLRSEVLERISNIVNQFRAYRVGVIALTLLPSVFTSGLGLYDSQSERSERAWWAVLKADLGQRSRESVRASLFLDLDEVLQEIGRENFFDFRFWYSARFPFSAEAAREIARRVIGLGAVIKFPKAKVIVLDADNTLWGGIIGEDGINGIALGPDYPGNAYLDFQRRILDYQQRGFILAICSKNNPADVDQVLKEHPHQILRDEHFAARRVNWLPKPDNLISLADELNLGLDSFIFVDDSDHECAAVHHKLPQVEVVKTPAKPIDLPSCLERIARLEVLSLTAEDSGKTELYAQERRRRDLKQRVDLSSGGLEDYLTSLEMKMWVAFNNSADLARLTQLIQKTNQFNLTTRRYNEQQMQEFMLDRNWLVAHFSLSDMFGDSGIVGLALFRYVSTETAELDAFLMSCRVIGREAESAFLHALLRYLTSKGVKKIVADYFPTPKNALVRSFLPDQAFDICADGRYYLDLSEAPAQPESNFPIAVELVT